MSASDLEKARKLLAQEEWGVKGTKSMAIGGAWLVSLEGSDEDGEDLIEICRLSLDEMEKLRSEFQEKFKRGR
jgi:hypothetical protein